MHVIKSSKCVYSVATSGIVIYLGDVWLRELFHEF